MQIYLLFFDLINLINHLINVILNPFVPKPFLK
jgi:hypothetical protein